MQKSGPNSPARFRVRDSLFVGRSQSSRTVPMKSTAELGFLDPGRICRDRDSNSTDSELVCSICHNILWKPVSCQTCENSFCSRCIETWLNKQTTRGTKQCPFQCTFESKRPPPILNSLLSKLNINCAYMQNGCRQSVPYDRLEAHEESCECEKHPCLICGIQVSDRPLAAKHDLRQCFESMNEPNPNQIQAQFLKLLDVVEASQRRIEALEKALEKK